MAKNSTIVLSKTIMYFFRLTFKARVSIINLHTYNIACKVITAVAIGHLFGPSDFKLGTDDDFRQH